MINPKEEEKIKKLICDKETFEPNYKLVHHVINNAMQLSEYSKMKSYALSCCLN